MGGGSGVNLWRTLVVNSRALVVQVCVLAAQGVNSVLQSDAGDVQEGECVETLTCGDLSLHSW